jgi:hypothetical protein
MATVACERPKAARQKRIREAAYLRSQPRRPDDGKEVEAWLAAEQRPSTETHREPT